jgi:hypothetical protein
MNVSLQSQQDTTNKKVKQKIFDEETGFDHSDFVTTQGPPEKFSKADKFFKFDA